MTTPKTSIDKILKLRSEGKSVRAIAKEVWHAMDTVRAWILRSEGKCGKCAQPHIGDRIWCDDCTFREKLKRSK